MAKKDRSFKLNLSQAILARAALQKYLRQAEGLEKDALGMNKMSLAKQIKDEREGLEEETMGKLEKVATMAKADKAVGVDLNAVEYKAIEAGLPKLIRDTRAAKGTVMGLLKGDWAAELEATAEQISSELVPMFSEQTDALAKNQNDDKEGKDK